MPQVRLDQLDFVDLYVCLEGDAEPHYHRAGDGGMGGELDVPPQFQAEIRDLTRHLRDEFKGKEMGLTFGGVRMRAAQVRTAGGLLWAALRKIDPVPLELDKLGLMPQLLPHLKALGQRDGLILICGATGQGKTTTSCSLLAEYLNRFGGVAFTIEDPVEYVLEGRHGKGGYCYQVEVHEDHEWASMLKASLRWHPRYIFVGEVRTPDAANQLLRAATSGHLVITTVHAGSIEEALEGLLQLAEQALGDRATSLLASGLTAVVHQSLGRHGLKTSFFVLDSNPAGPFRSCIRDRRIGLSRTLIDQQVSLLMQNGKLFRE